MANEQKARDIVYKSLKQVTTKEGYDDKWLLGKSRNDPKTGKEIKGLGLDKVKIQTFTAILNQEIIDVRTKAKKKKRYFKLSTFGEKTAIGTVVGKITEKLNENP